MKDTTIGKLQKERRIKRQNILSDIEEETNSKVISFIGLFAPEQGAIHHPDDDAFQDILETVGEADKIGVFHTNLTRSE